jgi:hypothetical protein
MTAETNSLNYSSIEALGILLQCRSSNDSDQPTGRRTNHVQTLRHDLYEFLVYAISRLGLIQSHRRLRKFRGRNVAHLDQPTLQGKFTAIYQNRIWLNGREHGSLSGSGSELMNTDSVRNALPSVLKSLGTKVLLDLGCGDFTWMKEVTLDCRYIGVDIVSNVIERNRERYAAATRTFDVLDAVSMPLPKADTVLCREMIFHLSFADIRRVLANVRASEARYLIATTDSGILRNADIASGDFRRLNLERKPLSFPAPCASIPDDDQIPERKLGIWRTEQLPEL